MTETSTSNPHGYTPEQSENGPSPDEVIEGRDEEGDGEGAEKFGIVRTFLDLVFGGIGGEFSYDLNGRRIYVTVQIK